MHETAETIVIGAGVIGAACAFRLARAGRRVRVIDPNPPGMGCSFGNAGLIAIDHVMPLANPDTLRSMSLMLLRGDSPLRVHLRAAPSWLPWGLDFLRAARPSRVKAGTAALASLVTRALPAWQTLCADARLPNLLSDTGAVYIYEKPMASSAQGVLERILTEHGVLFSNLTPQQVKQDYLPQLIAPIHGGRYFPDMARVADPHAVVTRLLDAAIDAGAQCTREKVTGFERKGDRNVGVVTHVTTTAGSFPCSSALLCAGIETAGLASQLGLRVPLIPERGYHIDVDPVPVTLPLAATFVERGFVVNPMDTGLRFAGTVEFGAGPEPDWRRADLLLRHGKELLRFEEGMLDKAKTSRWYGDRPTLPDYLPMLGRIPSLQNAFIATGHQHLGLTLAAITAEIIESLMAGDKQAALALAPFKTDRFACLS